MDLNGLCFFVCLWVPSKLKSKTAPDIGTTMIPMVLAYLLGGKFTKMIENITFYMFKFFFKRIFDVKYPFSKF